MPFEPANKHRIWQHTNEEEDQDAIFDNLQLSCTAYVRKFRNILSGRRKVREREEEKMGQEGRRETKVEGRDR